MHDPRDDLADGAQLATAVDSHTSPVNPSTKMPVLRDCDVLLKLLWTIPEAASILRVGERSVWRMMADPRSCFPRPRRIGGRTLLVRDEVLAFIAKGASR